MKIGGPKVFLIAGEASGDALGASLMRSLKEKDASFAGIGGAMMEEEGLKSIVPLSELSIMGIWEVLMQLPRILRLITGVVAEVEKVQPDVLVTIDYPDFNFEVARRLKKRGIFKGKIVHYVAPTVWAWRPGRAKRVAEFLDGMMCLFPFEPQYFEEQGLNAQYVGHPVILQDHKEDPGAFRRHHGLKDNDFVFGVYLGSRDSEIARHKEIFQDAIAFMREQYPEMQIILPTLPTTEYNAIEAVKGLNVTPVIVNGQEQKWDAMRSCNLAMAVSGTVGLELGYMNVPHIVVYKTHFITFLIIRLLVKVKFAHLINILLDKQVVPEFLQSRCKPILVAQELARLMKDEALMAQQRLAFHDCRKIMQKDVGDNPSDTAAVFILKTLNEQ